MEITHLLTDATPKEREKRIEALVCRLTGIDADAYAAQKFEKGIEFLERCLPQEETSRLIAKQALFWSWWRNRWTMREEEVLKNCDEEYLRRFGASVLEQVHRRSMAKMKIVGVITVRQ